MPAADGRGISELLEALHRTRSRGLSFPAELRALRWKDVEQPGRVDDHLVSSWEDVDTAWNLGDALGPFFEDDAAWLENLGAVAEALPLGLFLQPILRRMRAEMDMPLAASPDDVVETAFRGLGLHGWRPRARHSGDLEFTGEDLWLSQVKAVEEAMDAIGKGRFRRRGDGSLGAKEYRAVALLSLDGRLPKDWPATPATLQPMLQQLLNAQRRRRAPHGEARKRFAAYWSRPWAVPFPDESFIGARTREGIAWELAKWTRTRTFLRKRWVLGGGRHAVRGGAGPLPMTRLWEPFHYLGGRHVRPDLKLVGALRSWLLAFPEKPMSMLATDIAGAALVVADVADDLEARKALLEASRALMASGTLLRSGTGPVMMERAAERDAERAER